jgi:hypothetical protein
MAMASACCCAAFRVDLLGQSMLATVDTQAARNSCGLGGGVIDGPAGTAPGATTAGAFGLTVVQLVTRAAMASAAAMAKARLFRLGSTTTPFD